MFAHLATWLSAGLAVIVIGMTVLSLSKTLAAVYYITTRDLCLLSRSSTDGGGRKCPQWFKSFLCDFQGGDNAGALKAYEMMRNSGYQRAVTSATFNKLIQSASQTEGLESALQVGDSSKQ